MWLKYQFSNYIKIIFLKPNKKKFMIKLNLKKWFKISLTIYFLNYINFNSKTAFKRDKINSVKVLNI